MLGAPRKSRAFTNDYFIFATQALVDPKCCIDFAVPGHWTIPARQRAGASHKAGSNVLVRHYLSAVSDCCKPGMSFGVGNVHAFTRTIFKSTAETDTPRTSCSFSPLLGMDSISPSSCRMTPHTVALEGGLPLLDCRAGCYQLPAFFRRTYCNLMYSGKHIVSASARTHFEWLIGGCRLPPGSGTRSKGSTHDLHPQFS